MSQKYTPGPWHVEPVTDEHDEQCWSDDFNGKVFCVCHPDTVCNATVVVDWINEADARLIAQAPAMVEALRDHVAQWDGWSDYELSRRAAPAEIARFRRNKAILAQIDGEG